MTDETKEKTLSVKGNYIYIAEEGDDVLFLKLDKIYELIKKYGVDESLIEDEIRGKPSIVIDNDRSTVFVSDVNEVIAVDVEKVVLLKGVNVLDDKRSSNILEYALSRL